MSDPILPPADRVLDDDGKANIRRVFGNPDPDAVQPSGQVAGREELAAVVSEAAGGYNQNTRAITRVVDAILASSWLAERDEQHVALVARVEALTDEFSKPIAVFGGGDGLTPTPRLRALLAAEDTAAIDQVRAEAWRTAIDLIQDRQNEFVSRYSTEAWDRGFAQGLDAAASDIANHWHRAEQDAIARTPADPEAGERRG